MCVKWQTTTTSLFTQRSTASLQSLLPSFEPEESEKQFSYVKKCFCADQEIRLNGLKYLWGRKAGNTLRGSLTPLVAKAPMTSEAQAAQQLETQHSQYLRREINDFMHESNTLPP